MTCTGAHTPAGRYLTAIQLTSQHLLRYLAVAVVVNKRRRNVLNDLKRVVAQEAYEYRWGVWLWGGWVVVVGGWGAGRGAGRGAGIRHWMGVLGLGGWPDVVWLEGGLEE